MLAVAIAVMCSPGSAPSAADALLRAAHAGDETAVESALRRGALVDTLDESDQTALIIAARHGHRSLVATLLRHRADVNHQGRFIGSALTEAIIYGYPEIAADLLAAGADPNLCNFWGEVPL